MSSQQNVNAGHYRQYLQAATDEELKAIIDLLPTAKLKKELKRSFEGLQTDTRIRQGDQTKIENQLRSFESNKDFVALRETLVQRRTEQLSNVQKETKEAIKQGASEISYTLFNQHGEAEKFDFVLEEIPRDEALTIIKISPLNARTTEILPPHVVADVMSTLPHGQKEAAFGYRVGNTIYLFDGLRRISAYHHIDTDRPFRIYVTDKELNLFHYQSYDLMDLAKLARTPLQNLTHWLKLAEMAGVKIGKSFTKEEHASAEDTERFFDSVGVSYNTYKAYANFETISPELIAITPDQHRLSKTQLTSLVQQQKAITKSNQPLEEVIGSYSDSESANNKEFIERFKSFVSSNVLNKQEPQKTTETLYKSGSKVVKKTMVKNNNKTFDVSISAKRISAKNLEILEKLIGTFTDDLD
ncbi:MULTISPECIES: hypothetical protein [Vibrio]|uniref:hypothetical protein n=1 Tax=Vibrio TaxID=662 RepID=UPI00078E0450|nr:MULTISPECIES: hypothetical protein [Vibrio]BAU70932.1 hypothetical protein [Vibrio sp. 04Ya108]BBM67810.1 hypothetical protein VA249_44560 [Vibrio alfacsensis]BCN26981.1 hypothetical protein VYA_41730 [Vibrio alfacsensis]